MFAIITATALSVAGPHILGQAFGYRLGEMPGVELASCEDDGADQTSHMYVCAGDAFFSNVFVQSRRGLIVDLSASRRYKGPDFTKATADCLGDLTSLRSVLNSRYPGLQPARPFKANSFKLTESSYYGLAIGRSVRVRCEDALGSVDKSKRTGVVLWLSYSLSAEEFEAIGKLESADELKGKGLDPSKL